MNGILVCEKTKIFCCCFRNFPLEPIFLTLTFTEGGLLYLFLVSTAELNLKPITKLEISFDRCTRYLKEADVKMPKTIFSKE